MRGQTCRDRRGQPRRDGKLISVEDTSLSLDTVRTIVGKMTGADRNMKKHARRLGLDLIKIERGRVATWRRQKRTGDALPGRVNALLKASAEP